ncbi:MAG: pinensin family lanthipeptide [Cyclobacteriaceae bacterium]
MKKKLNLDKLRIDSFVTDLKDAKAQTVKGGLPPYTEWRCVPETGDCPSEWCSLDCTDDCFTWNLQVCC